MIVNEFIQQYESTIRLSVFLGVFSLMALWEVFAPRKQLVIGRGSRWLTNWALVVIDSVAVRILVPVLAVAWAEQVALKGWGLFNLISMPGWLEFILAIIVLDMLIYWQHVASHYIPLLWHIHKVHHADRDIDVTTGARFHPIEIVVSMFFKLFCILVLGPAAIAVFVFEVLLNASAMFNHSNIKLPKNLDTQIRKVIVTPDMHRVHHSVIEHETNSNYGFFLSIWDRLFKSYIDQPSAGHDEMIIGLKSLQSSEPSNLWWTIKAPFLSVAQQTQASTVSGVSRASTISEEE